MKGTPELPGNVDALAADGAAGRAEDEGSAAQAYATLALAYEQRTIALIEAAALLQRKGSENAAGELLERARERLGGF